MERTSEADQRVREANIAADQRVDEAKKTAEERVRAAEERESESIKRYARDSRDNINRLRDNNERLNDEVKFVKFVAGLNIEEASLFVRKYLTSKVPRAGCKAALMSGSKSYAHLVNKATEFAKFLQNRARPPARPPAGPTIEELDDGEDNQIAGEKRQRSM